ncbi:MAG: hypothetical protein HC827_12800 [Cyanobacteria bacterium RM1_2_2]|nr:hypothetical protein [Cyanobacteria bacterium RM1_2_2]
MIASPNLPIQEFCFLGAVIHSSENPDDGKAAAPRLFWGTGAIRRMRQAFDPERMTRPRNLLTRSGVREYFKSPTVGRKPS